MTKCHDNKNDRKTQVWGTNRTMSRGTRQECHDKTNDRKTKV